MSSVADVKWLIETQTTSYDDMESLMEAIRDQGMEFVSYPFIPFSEEIIDIFPPDSCVVFVGSLRTSSLISRKTKWVPGTINTLENYRCIRYFPLLGEYIFNQPYVMMPVGELHRHKQFLLDSLAPVARSVFIRPDRGDKIWTGLVSKGSSWEADMDRINISGDVSPHDIAVVAPPRSISREWRLMIVDGRIITGSQYHPIKEAGVPADVISFAEMVISNTGFYPDNAWVMDVCSDMKGDLAIMEVGGFSCAGMYHCDRAEIVRAVSEAALKEWSEYNEV